MQRNSSAGQGIRLVEVVVEVDGGSRGNPGPAGYGAVVFSRGPLGRAGRGQTVDRPRDQQRRRIPGPDRRFGCRRGTAAPPTSRSGWIPSWWSSKCPDGGRSSTPTSSSCTLRPGRRRRGSTGSATHGFRGSATTHADRLANEAMDAAAAAPVGESPAEPPKATATPSLTAPGWTGARGTPTRLLLLRHGQTALSLERRYSGRGNPELTELGRRQASSGGAVSGAARRDRRRDLITAATGLRHRGGGREGAGSGRHRRRRSDRDRFRSMGRIDLRRGRRTGSGSA